MKETYYFQHDYNARQDPKMQDMMVEHGISAVGVYWCIVEMLYEQGGRLSLKAVKSIAYSLHVDVSLVASVVNDFGLFLNDGKEFWSESANRRLQKRADVSEAKRKAIKARWGKKDTNVLQMNNSTDTNVLQMNTKEIKEKEIKEKEIKEKEIKEKEIKEKEIKEKEIKEKENINITIKRESVENCTAVAVPPPPLEVKKKEFIETLSSYLDRYPQDMIDDFASYWTEPNKAHTKMRYQMEKTWDTARRLATWAKHDREWHGRSQANGKTSMFEEINRLNRTYSKTFDNLKIE